MWWLWPYFKRIWAMAATVVAGLTINYLYGLWGRQSVPSLGDLSSILYRYWYFTGGLLAVFVVVSVFAERAHRRHEVRAPKTLRAWQSRRDRFKRQASPDASLNTSTSMMVGRTGELAKLNDWFALVKTGSRRLIFVSGEPGIGKTTLTRAFLESVASDSRVRVGRGQCVEQYGAGEPYMPILEALTRLCREPDGDKLVEILHRLAPAWLAQMPSLVSAEDRARLQGLVQGTTQQRMLREMAEALEVIAADAPLVLFIEDLHWSDPSTLDLIATVARRSEPARLMILGTYRPVEMLTGESPLRAIKGELELHQQAIELRLPLLSETDVASYLQQRFPVSGIPRATTSPVQSDRMIDTAEALARGNSKRGSAEPRLSFPRAEEDDLVRSASSSRPDKAARGIPDSISSRRPYTLAAKAIRSSWSTWSTTWSSTARFWARRRSRRRAISAR
jgi:hypothetical protein